MCSQHTRSAVQPCLSQPDPHRSTHWDPLVVEVVTRVVQHAGSRAVAADAMTAIAIANQKIAAGLFEQVVAEVFSPHRGFSLLYILLTDHVTQHTAHELSFLGMVDRWRIAASEFELAARFERRAGRLCDLPHAPLDHVQPLQCEGAYGALQFTGVRPYISRLSGPD